MPEQTPQGATTSLYMSYGASGGGGLGSDYVFTDLAHLDRIIARWSVPATASNADGQDLKYAIDQIVPPLTMAPASRRAKAARESLIKGPQHNQAMLNYADGYIVKLAAARARYATTEEDNVDRLRNVDNVR